VLKLNLPNPMILLLFLSPGSDDSPAPNAVRRSIWGRNRVVYTEKSEETGC